MRRNVITGELGDYFHSQKPVQEVFNPKSVKRQSSSQLWPSARDIKVHECCFIPSNSNTTLRFIRSVLQYFYMARLFGLQHVNKKCVFYNSLAFQTNFFETKDKILICLCEKEFCTKNTHAIECGFYLQQLQQILQFESTKNEQWLKVWNEMPGLKELQFQDFLFYG